MGVSGGSCPARCAVPGMPKEGTLAPWPPLRPQQAAPEGRDWDAEVPGGRTPSRLRSWGAGAQPWPRSSPLPVAVGTNSCGFWLEMAPSSHSPAGDMLSRLLGVTPEDLMLSFGPQASGVIKPRSQAKPCCVSGVKFQSSAGEQGYVPSFHSCIASHFSPLHCQPAGTKAWSHTVAFELSMLCSAPCPFIPGYSNYY